MEADEKFNKNNPLRDVEPNVAANSLEQDLGDIIEAGLPGPGVIGEDALVAAVVADVVVSRLFVMWCWAWWCGEGGVVDDCAC